MQSMKEALGNLDESLVNMEEKADEHLRRFHDNAIRRAANMALQAIGNVVEESMKPAFIPKPMKKVAKFAFDGTWPDIRDTLEESIVASKSYAFSGNFSRKALDYWPEKAELWGEAGPWKSWPRHPFRWFKAKFLYAVMPADANAFKHLQDPVAITIILLKLCPYYGINIWLFVIRFFLIDRSDEGTQTGAGTLDLHCPFRCSLILGSSSRVNRPARRICVGLQRLSAHFWAYLYCTPLHEFLDLSRREYYECCGGC